MKIISPIELQRLLTAQPDLYLIDVRTPLEFAEVHVPQARNIPLDELKSDSLPIQEGQPVYLICRSGSRAMKAAVELSKQGSIGPVVVGGGTLAWIEANLPVTRGLAKVISLERQVRIAAGSLVVTGVLLGWFVHRGFFGLAAFVGCGLVFAGITDFCGMGLLLAKMPWNKKAPQ
jgi:rhodanese-related sulfurtransferase